MNILSLDVLNSIAAFARVNDINSMFDEYEAMKLANIKPDCYTMSIVINGVLKGIVFVRNYQKIPMTQLVIYNKQHIR